MIPAYGLFTVGLVCVVCLTIIFVLSSYYYYRAKQLAPHLMKKEALLKDIGEAQANLSKLAAQIGAKQIDIANAEAKIAQGKQAEDDYKNNAKERVALENDVRNLKLDLDKLRKDYNSENKKFQELQTKVSTTNTEWKNKKDECDDWERRAKRAKQEEATITQQIQKLEADISALADDRNRLDAMVRSLGIDRERLIRENADEAKRLKVRKDENNALKTEEAELRGVVNTLRTSQSECIAQVEENKRRWDDLDRAIEVVAVPSPDSLKPQEQRWLQGFYGLLKEHNIIFNERMIYAFHTALKCAKSSPLVVLSGISGTGKSLLPELYSAALGLNFMPIAVQPRWDSPQDLFGFYNYMERKFKATALSRLLWQCDKDNNKKSSSARLRANGMNLILLDEMNLARVEYYFSDLLSKLEIRNGINPEDVESRKKAEIELECGTSQSRRLFIGENTLFVGTMNEDESTQMLSDKVIDRANVLRFGKPKTLDGGNGNTSDKAGFLDACKKLSKIDYATWRSWRDCGLVCSANIAGLSSKLDLLNEQLAQVGRPFGWRTSNAIESYVKSYPADNFNDAWADQIEMKILPKLNGLDLNADCFDSVKNAVLDEIKSTGDSALETAFESACKPEKTFFKWRGVMR